MTERAKGGVGCGLWGKVGVLTIKNNVVMPNLPGRAGHYGGALAHEEAATPLLQACHPHPKNLCPPPQSGHYKHNNVIIYLSLKHLNMFLFQKL